MRDRVTQDASGSRRAPHTIGYTFGAFDILHLDHLDQLLAARSHCDHLVVGVLSDEVVLATTGTAPVNPYAERLQIVRALSPVDTALGQLLDDLDEVWHQVQFDVLLLPPEPPETAVSSWLRTVVDVRPLTRTRRSSSGLVERAER